MSDRSRQEDEIEVLESIYDKDLVISSRWPGSGCLFISPDPITEEMNINIVNIVNQTPIEKTVKLRYLAPIELYFQCPKDYPSKSQPMFMLKCIWLPEHLLCAVCRELDGIWDRTHSEILYDWAYFLKDSCSFLNIDKLNFTTQLDEPKIDDTAVPYPDTNQLTSLRLKELKSKLPEERRNENEMFFGERLKKKKTRRVREQSSKQNFRYETPKDVKISNQENWQFAQEGESTDDVSSASVSSCSFSKTLEYILSVMSTYGVRRKIQYNECDTRVIPNHEEMKSDKYGNRGMSVIVQKLIDFNEECIQKIFRNETHFCDICLEQRQGSVSVRMQSCGHIFCRDCVTQYLSVNITSNNLRSLRCPTFDCETTFTPSQIRQHVDDETFQKFEKFAQKMAVEDDPNLLYCPRNVCQSVARRCPELGPELCYCSRCSFYFCLYCKKAYHGVQACQLQNEERIQVIHEYLSADSRRQIELEKRYTKQQLRKWVDEYLTAEYIEESSKPCPNCGVPIQKNDGCNKMLCSNCNIPFCWLCNKCLSTARPYDHFSVPNSPCYQKLFPFNEQEEEFIDFDDEEEAFLEFLLF